MKGKKYQRKNTKRTYKGPYRPKAAKKQIKEVVKKVIASKIETKVVQQAGTLLGRSIRSPMTTSEFQSTNVCLTPQGAALGAFTGNYYILGNSIGVDGRIGDEAKIKGIYFNYNIYAEDYNATTNNLPFPIIATLFVVKPKSGMRFGFDQNSIQAGANANFFENVANNDSGLQGDLADLVRKIDRDNYQVLAMRQHKIGWAGQLNTTNVVASFQNNDFKQYSSGKIKLKGFNWKVDRADIPQGQNIYAFLHCVRADGALMTTNQIVATLNYNIACYYIDP